MGARKMVRRNPPIGRKNRMFAVQLMEHLVVPAFVLDAEGVVIIWNRACERLTGIRGMDVIGTRDHWKGFYESPRPCLADLVLCGRSNDIADLYTVNRSEAFGKNGLSAENWCQPPNGSGRRYLALDAGPIYTDGGKLLAVVETIRDITVQKGAQMELEALASQDGLTGVANRRVFNECLDLEWRRAGDECRPLSLLMIDIDHFKQYNDALGHQEGDDCLRRTAALISEQMTRPTDLVARYGGEEFAVVLPGAGLADAMLVAERILAAMKSAALPHPSPDVCGHVSVSIGAGCNVDDCASPERLVSLADASLYSAKRQGRNRAVAVQRLTLPSVAA